MALCDTGRRMGGQGTMSDGERPLTGVREGESGGWRKKGTTRGGRGSNGVVGTWQYA